MPEMSAELLRFEFGERASVIDTESAESLCFEFGERASVIDTESADSTELSCFENGDRGSPVGPEKSDACEMFCVDNGDRGSLICSKEPAPSKLFSLDADTLLIDSAGVETSLDFIEPVLFFLEEMGFVEDSTCSTSDSGSGLENFTLWVLSLREDLILLLS